jgi:2-haloacid dehalogenase
MAISSKNVVFDIEGTLVGYEHMFEAIDTRLGDALRAEGVKPTLLGFAWIEVAEREYAYLSMSGHYVPYTKIIETIFWRILSKAGISEPRKFATTEDLIYIMDAYKQLKMRPGAKECIQKLRDAGFTLWAFTMADPVNIKSYFKEAEIEWPAENVLCCDTDAVCKPDREAYRPLLKKLSSSGGQPWFAAAHMWDSSAAKRTGCVLYP